jgi:hypothetical protein
VIGDNLQLLASMYARPARTMGRILDEGSLLFGAVAVLLVGLVLSLGLFLPLWATIETQLEGVQADGTRSQSKPTPEPAASRSFEELLESPEGPGRTAVTSLMARAVFGTMFSGIFSSLAALAVLYVPACLVAATALAPIGSFGVVFRRDYGGLLACTLFSWTAAHLPFALASLGVPGLTALQRAALLLAGLVVFAAFMVLAVRAAVGVPVGSAIAITLLGSLGLVLAPIAPFAGSPFLLYVVWQYFRGEISDVSWIFGRRQGFKRHLEAATLNPRDAEAHYQLGLLHQQRREIDEAKTRFEKAVEIDSREIDAHYQLGRIAREKGQFEEAIRRFEEVVRQDETHARHEVWREIGATYLASTSWANARWALEKYVSKRPHDPEGLLLLGQSLSASGEKAPADDAYRRCIESVNTMPAFRRGEVTRFKRQAKKLLSA